MNDRARLTVTGHYAGVASRAAGGLLDIGILFALFTASLSGVDLLARVIAGTSLGGQEPGLVWAIALAAWAFLYEYGSLAIAGRTPGKGIVGLRVVAADGSTLNSRRALLRTLVKPISIAFLGLGFIGILVHRERRALHDLVAGTAVVYDWGRRAAELPGPLSDFLVRRAGDEYGSVPPR